MHSRKRSGPDLRHVQGFLLISILLLWIGGIAVGILYWKGHGIKIGVGMLIAGGVVALNESKFYLALAPRTWPEIKGKTPGRDYLIFFGEDFATCEKQKLFGEYCGVIYAENECFRLLTRQLDETIPFEQFSATLRLKNEKKKGVILEFPVKSQSEPLKIAAGFCYTGPDSDMSGDVPMIADWSLIMLETIKSNAPATVSPGD